MEDTDDSSCSVNTQANVSMNLSTSVNQYDTNEFTMNSRIKDITVTGKSRYLK